MPIKILVITGGNKQFKWIWTNKKSNCWDNKALKFEVD